MPKLGRARRELPIAEIEHRYLAGDSMKQLAVDYGIARHAIAMRLVERGVEIRGRSAANLIRMEREGPEGRKNLAAAAHAANTGKRHTRARRIAIAESREANGSHVTHNERQLRLMLAGLGIQVVPQKAVGPYNIDLAAWPLAIEIFGGKWHWYGRHAATWPKRRKFLTSRGWSVLVIRVDHRTPIGQDTANLVARYVHEAQPIQPSGLLDWAMGQRVSEPVLRTPFWAAIDARGRNIRMPS